MYKKMGIILSKILVLVTDGTKGILIECSEENCSSFWRLQSTINMLQILFT